MNKKTQLYNLLEQTREIALDEKLTDEEKQKQIEKIRPDFNSLNIDVNKNDEEIRLKTDNCFQSFALANNSLIDNKEAMINEGNKLLEAIPKK